MVAYLLNMICLNLLLLFKIVYINFLINLTQFYINFSRKEHQIGVFLCIVQRLRFHPIPPFIFSLQSLYKETKLNIFSLQKIKWQKLCKRLTNTEYQFFIVKVFYVFFVKMKFLCCKTECHASWTK